MAPRSQPSSNPGLDGQVAVTREIVAASLIARPSLAVNSTAANSSNSSYSDNRRSTNHDALYRKQHMQETMKLLVSYGQHSRKQSDGRCANDLCNGSSTAKGYNGETNDDYDDKNKLVIYIAPASI